MYFDNQWLKQFPSINLENNVIKNKDLYKKIIDICKMILDDEKNLEKELNDFFEELSLFFVKDNLNDEMNILINDIKEYLL